MKVQEFKYSDGTLGRKSFLNDRGDILCWIAYPSTWMLEGNVNHSIEFYLLDPEDDPYGKKVSEKEFWDYILDNEYMTQEEIVLEML